jgi:hypothetical protein
VQAGDIEDKGVSPAFVVRNWPTAFKEWSTKSVRDMFFASPTYPRLLNPDSLKDTIKRGVENGMIAYVGKKPDGGYSPFHWNASLPLPDIEISEDAFLVLGETAEAYVAAASSPAATPEGRASISGSTISPSRASTLTPPGGTSATGTALATRIPRFIWSGDVPHQKWMNFYTKVLSKFAAAGGLRLTLRVEVAPPEGVSSQKVDETRVALRELGLDDSLDEQ